jgi:hypothetical protein
MHLYIIFSMNIAWFKISGSFEGIRSYMTKYSRISSHTVYFLIYMTSHPILSKSFYT